jgi:TolB-like protein/tetratricopeptide (TPR) repeat protein
MNASDRPDRYEFGPFRLDLDRRELSRAGTQVPLRAKSFELLAVLLEHAGAPVTKETLLSRVWSGVAVEENSIAKAISEVRRALGEGPRSSRFVRTLSGQGYCFAAAVERIARPAQPRRIAVLPFSPLIGGEEHEYLAVGLADSLITRLSRLREVIVRPTRAILPFAGAAHDVVAAGRQLDVDSVLDGTVRRADDRVRVTAQLVDVSTGTVTWADTFDEPFSGVLSLEDVISERVAAALALVVTDQERRRLTKRHTGTPEAHEWDMKGRVHLARRTAADCWHAIESFGRALKADPNDALAYSGIAEAYVALGVQALVMGGLPPSEAFPQAKAAIEQALKLDPQLADAHTARAQVSFLYDWRADEAARSHRAALDLDPRGAWTQHAWAMMLTFSGHHDSALAAMHQARQLDPLSPVINTNLGRVLYNARRYEEAVDQLQWTVARAPEVVIAHHRLALALDASHRLDEAIREFECALRLSAGAPVPSASLACTYARSGRREDAEGILQSLVARSRTEYVAAPCIAELYVALDDHDRAFEWLDKAVEERSSMLVTMQTSHHYDPLRGDSRFARLVERVGIWKAASPEV